MTYTMRIEAKEFKHCLDLAFSATDRELNSRYSINCIQLELSSELTQLIGTDGRRLHAVTLANVHIHNLPETSSKHLLTAELCRFLLKSCAKGVIVLEFHVDGTITATIPKGNKGEKVEQYTQTETDLGRYPDWRLVIPTNTPNMEVRGDATEFRKWVSYIRESIPSTKLFENRIVVTYENANSRNPNRYSSDTPNLKYVERGDYRLSFNPNYLESILDCLGERMPLELTEHDRDGQTSYIVKIGGYAQAVFMGYN